MKRAGALKNDAKRILLRDLILLGFRAEFQRRGGIVQLLLQLDLVVLALVVLFVLALVVPHTDSLPPPARPEIEEIVGVILLSLLRLRPPFVFLALAFVGLASSLSLNSSRLCLASGSVYLRKSSPPPFVSPICL